MGLSPVTVPAEAGEIWWQVPDALWLRFARMRNRRLFKAVETHLLPQLVQLEALYAAKNHLYKPILKGKSMAQILADPNATEIGMGLFDLAVGEKLVVLKKGRANATGFGACNMTVNQAKNGVIRAASERVLKAAKSSKKSLDLFFGTGELTDPSILTKLSILLQFDPRTTQELKIGLGPKFGDLAKKDAGYLAIMQAYRPLSVLRPLRVALKDEFPRILTWDAEYLAAVSEGLDHPAKIMALGRDLLSIDDAGKIRALGEWEFEELPQKPGDKKKTYRTRIGEVKKLIGFDFLKTMDAPADVIRGFGSWSDEEIERIKHVLGVVSGDILEILSELSITHQAGILDGLWEKFGKSFLETGLNKPVGLQAVRDLVAEVQKMEARGSSPTDLRTMIVTDFFHVQLRAFSLPK